MDITITIRGLEELGLGLSALAAALPETARQLATLLEAARQLAALGRHNGTGANNVSTAALQPPAQLSQTPDRPTPVQNATATAAAAAMPPWQTDPAQEATTAATDNTPMNAASTQNKTEPHRQPTLEDVRAVLARPTYTRCLTGTAQRSSARSTRRAMPSCCAMLRRSDGPGKARAAVGVVSAQVAPLHALSAAGARFSGQAQRGGG